LLVFPAKSQQVFSSHRLVTNQVLISFDLHDTTLSWDQILGNYLLLISGRQAVPYLVEAMRSKDEKDRDSANDILCCVEIDKQNLARLLEILKDPDPDVRADVAELISEHCGCFYCPLKGETVFTSLMEALRDPDSRVRMRATDGLGHFKDKRAVDALIVALKDNDEFVRGSAASALGYIKDQKAVQPLIEALKDPDKDVREHAIESLGYIGGTEAVNALLEFVKVERDEPLHEDAVRSLIQSSDKQTAGLILKELISFQVPDDLVSLLNDMPYLRCDNNIGELIIPLLKNENYEVRQAAARALGQLKVEKAVPDLIKATGDKKFEMSIEAVRALGNIGDRRAFPVLMNILRGNKGELKYYAISALGGIRDTRAIPVLLDIMKKDDANRTCAACAFSNIWDKRAVAPIEEVLRKIDRRNRMGVASVCLALARSGDEKTAERAMKTYFYAFTYSGYCLIHGSEEWAKSCASCAPAVVSALSSNDRMVRNVVLQTLLKMDRPAIPALISGLKSDSLGVRLGAARTLVLLTQYDYEGEPLSFTESENYPKKIEGTPIPALMEALKDGDWRIRKGAAQVLGDIGDVRAYKPLEKLLTDRNRKVRCEAKLAIRKIYHPQLRREYKIPPIPMYLSQSLPIYYDYFRKP
ncbi:MAG: HEAT repeat domain-containing protein, partial [Chloroflexi bacterium]|nr:HEAT repeat domain-containing protein [Chloroflexota bacterium]